MKTFAVWTVIGSQHGLHDSADLSCHKVLVEEVVPSYWKAKLRSVIPHALNKC